MPTSWWWSIMAAQLAALLAVLVITRRRLRTVRQALESVRSESRQLEAQLRHAQKMEILGTLVGGIAHDFNNQLTAIIGNLSLALAATPPGAAGRIEMADAEQAAQRCAEMARGLLTFSRRRAEPALTLDLNKVVDEGVRLLQRLLPAAIRVEVQTEPQLWRVRTENTELHQILLNLAVNARDAMPQGGRLRITTANCELTPADCATHPDANPGRYVVLTVSDTGSGMSPEIRAHIFEPFFTTKAPGLGTGLGLAVVLGIVKAQGGYIAVESEVGRGTTFCVYLPGVEETVQRPSGAPLPAVAGGTECILVVDDEDMIRRLARLTLERWGFRVLTAADGEEALAIYCEHIDDIDLVILDYTMPKMNGLQVLEVLRNWNPAVRVVISSGYTIEHEGDRLLPAGVHGFIAKPYRPEKLVQTVRQALDPQVSKAAGPCNTASVTARPG